VPTYSTVYACHHKKTFTLNKDFPRSFLSKVATIPLSDADYSATKVRHVSGGHERRIAQDTRLISSSREHALLGCFPALSQEKHHVFIR
jgi:hypothetical protein